MPAPLLALLLLLHLTLFTTAQSTATNTTLIHGWVPEPPTRGTYSLLLSSLATITLCTWSALHLNPTALQRGWWRRFGRKVAYMLVLTVAPEVGLAIAVGNLLRARKMMAQLTATAAAAAATCDGAGIGGIGEGAQRGSGWTLTHMLFACGEGFWVRSPASAEGEARVKEGGSGGDGGAAGSLVPCPGTQLVAGIQSGLYASPPPVSCAELQSRSRSDWAVKTIAVLQIVWFVVQVLVRVRVGFQVSALEIMTAAYVACSLLTYGAAWLAPQNVEFPVVLEAEVAAVGGGVKRVESESVASEGTSRRLSVEEATPPLSPPPVGAETTLQAREYEPWGWLVALPVGSTFGAIHCLAWNAPFPTRAERDIWRMCAGTMTSLPLFITPEIVGWRFLHLGRYLNMFERGSEAFLAALVFYTVVRLLIIVLAFISVRVLQADAYVTVNWSQHIPHFGV